MSGFSSSKRVSQRKKIKKLLNEKRVESWKEKQMYGQFIREDKVLDLVEKM